MNTDSELEEWRREWQGDSEAIPPVPADLRAKVERQTRAMKLMRMADVLVTVTIGGAVIANAAVSPEAGNLLLTGATWLFIAIAWAFSLTLHRRNWAPSALDTASFVDLSIRRCRAHIAATHFGAGLAACEIVFCLWWIHQRSPDALKATVPMALVATGTVGLFIFLFWYRRRKRAELVKLLQMR